MSLNAMANMKNELTAKRVIVNEWNRSVAVGARVEYRNDRGETVATATSSPACLLSGHTPVVWLEGVRGCVALTHVTPRN